MKKKKEVRIFLIHYAGGSVPLDHNPSRSSLTVMEQNY